MKLSHPFRLIVAFVTLFSLLFMQLAIAAYACPVMASGSDEGRALVVMSSAMPGCAGMDAEQPTLCHAASQNDLAKQSLDKPPGPDVQPFIAATLVLAVQAAAVPGSPSSNTRHFASLSRATSPPIAIRHCCLRI
jgi:hypothetical protein